jgi:hypothetical protein
MAAPPAGAQWARDLDRGRGDAEAVLRLQDVESLSRTWGHVADVAKDFRRDAELQDLLSSTSKEDTYQQNFQGVRGRA